MTCVNIVGVLINIYIYTPRCTLSPNSPHTHTLVNTPARSSSSRVRRPNTQLIQVRLKILLQLSPFQLHQDTITSSPSHTNYISILYSFISLSPSFYSNITLKEPDCNASPQHALTVHTPWAGIR
jgi:hypothetical protein